MRIIMIIALFCTIALYCVVAAVDISVVPSRFHDDAKQTMLCALFAAFAGYVLGRIW